MKRDIESILDDYVEDRQALVNELKDLLIEEVNSQKKKTELLNDIKSDIDNELYNISH